MENILVYALTENIGGIEEYVLNLTRYKTTDNKYGYVILGEKTPYDEEINQIGAQYWFVPKRSHMFQNIKKLNTLFRDLRKDYHVLYVNTSNIGYIIPYYFAIKYKYKIVLHSHLDGSKTAGPIKKIIHKINYQIIRKHIDARFACSTPAGQWMFGKNGDSFTIIPNAIQIERFKMDYALRKQFRKHIQASEDTIVIGCVGRLTAFKNQSFLLSVMECMKSKNNSFKLILVGDGEDRSMLENQVKKAGLKEHVVFWGKTPKPEEIMNAMDCIVMPSIAEGFPITLVEAQAKGLPCLISNIITSEVDICGNVKSLSLEESKEKWCDAILEIASTGIKDNSDVLRKKGYDVETLESRLSKLIDMKIRGVEK